MKIEVQLTRTDKCDGCPMVPSFLINGLAFRCMKGYLVRIDQTNVNLSWQPCLDRPQECIKDNGE